VVFTAAVVDDIGDCTHQRVKLAENSRMERNIMPQRDLNFVQYEWKCFLRFAASVLFVLFLGCSFVPTFAQQPGQRTFASAEDAASALFAAMHGQDEDSSLSILGPAGRCHLLRRPGGRFGCSRQLRRQIRGDASVRDRGERSVTLVVELKLAVSDSLGEEQRFVYFDTVAGKDEVLFRRIGRNELAAMDACRNWSKRKNNILRTRQATSPSIRSETGPR